MARAPRYNPKTGVLVAPPGNYAAQHLLISAHGALPGGEVWSAGLRTSAAVLTQDELNIYAFFAQRCWAKAFEPSAGVGIASLNPAECTFVGVTARLVDVTGVTVYLAESTGVTPLAGHFTTAGGPDQLALAITLTTPTPGRHGKGRFYIPCLSPTMLNNGRQNSGITTALASTFANLIDDLNGGSGAVPGWTDTKPQHRISVQSRTAHTQSPVTGISVGNVVDTLRGRRDNLAEVYSSNNVPTPVWAT